MDKIKVILIEDDAEINTGYCYLINHSTDFTCKGFLTAEAGFESLKNENANIVLMDVNLPGMSGIECAALIKASYPDTLIMMLTVYENNENVFKALEAGASGYIIKQTSPEELVKALKDLQGGGAPMSSSIARKVVSSFNRNTDKEIDQYQLSPREQEVLQLLAGGFRYKDIAEKLFISVSTVRSHIYSIYEKLHVHNRTEALNKYSGRN